MKRLRNLLLALKDGKHSLMSTPKMVAVVLAALLLFSGCYPIDGLYPEDIAEEWVCTMDNLEFRICTKRDDIYGELVTDSYIIWNGEYVEVEVDFRGGAFWVRPLRQKGDQSLGEALLHGSWRMSGDKLVLIIRHDEIFGGAYTRLNFYGVESLRFTEYCPISIQ